MIKIEDREQWYSADFMAGDNETAHLDVPTAHGAMPFSIKFIPGKQGDQLSGTWRTEAGRVIMEFTGWNNPLGVCLTKPKRLGEIDGKPLGFQIAAQYIGGTNLVHFFLFKGGSYE